MPDELIVRLRGGGSIAELASIRATLGAVGVRSFRTVAGLYLLKLPATRSVTLARQLARALAGVAYAEPNYIVKTQTLPDDPLFVNLWGLHNTGQLGGTPGADIHAPEAWNITTGSSAVVVATIDTGVDYTHQDLAANMFRNEADCNANGVDDDGDGYIDDCYGVNTLNHTGDPMDDHGHGTHTAGTVGAVGNNAIGVVGVNWNVKLMPCKFLGANGMGSTADAVTCLDYIALMKDRGINIVATNNSWGGGGYSQALFDAIDAQRQRGILFIASAGNDTNDNDALPVYPASYDLPNVIAVAATTRTDTESGFSNYGRHTLHLGAPGSGILSTTPNNTYSTMSGTSMASPHVAGVAALLKAQDPSRDWRAIRNLILAGGDDNANLGNTVTSKRLNAYKAMTCSNSTVFSRLRPVRNTVTATVGGALTLSALNINCGAGAGNVTVTASNGQVVSLKDDGAVPDQAAGDGIYSGSFVPGSSGQIVLTFPNSDNVIVQVLSGTPYSVASTAFSYRQFAGVNLNLADDASRAIGSPFPINFGGFAFDTLFVSSNGTLNVSGANDQYANVSLPTALASNLIAPFWDDLIPVADPSSNVFWEVTGATPNRELVVEWRNVTSFLLPPATCDSPENITFQVVFFEGRSDILFNYADATFGGSCSFRNRGGSATVGIQLSPSVASQYSFNSESVNDGTALLWTFGAAASGFTDDPLVAGATLIKGIHVIELRARIDAARSRFALAAMTWTDPAVIAGVTVPKAQHLIELRTALTEAYQAAGIAPPIFTDPTIQPGQTVIGAVHIAELRAAVLALEGS